MNSKKAITLLVLATLIMSFVPLVQVRAAVTITDVTFYNGDALANVRKGHKLEVTGSGVTAGATVNVYWDDAFKETFTDGSGKMNSTKAKKDGSFLVWLKVPEALIGTHYIWVKDVSTGNTYGGFGLEGVVTIVSYLTVSPSSGLKGDTITLKGYGYGDELDVDDIVFEDDMVLPSR